MHSSILTAAVALQPETDFIYFSLFRISRLICYMCSTLKNKRLKMNPSGRVDLLDSFVCLFGCLFLSFSRLHFHCVIKINKNILYKPIVSGSCLSVWNFQNKNYVRFVHFVRLAERSQDGFPNTIDVSQCNLFRTVQKRIWMENIKKL